MKEHWKEAFIKTTDAHSMFYGIEKEEAVNLVKIRKEKVHEVKTLYLPIIKKSLTSFRHKTVMEFGSGEGVAAKFLSPMFKEYYCVDVIEEFLEICKDYTISCENIKYELLKDYYFTDFSLKSESVDLIIANNVFCHCNYYEFIIYFSKFYELMKDDSIVIFDLYNSDSEVFTHKDNSISNFVNLYKKDNVLDRLIQPISSDMIKRELSNIGFSLIYDSGNTENTSWNLLGFKK